MIGWMFYITGMVSVSVGVALSLGPNVGLIALGVFMLIAATLAAIDSIK